MSAPAAPQLTRSGTASASPQFHPSGGVSGSSSKSRGTNGSTTDLSPDPTFEYPSTRMKCEHTKEMHILLPHEDIAFWKATTKALEPLASYYVEFILPSKRGESVEGNDRCIWRDHYVPAGTERPPVFPSATCLAFLQSVRHPASEGKMTGKSLLHTLDTVMEPLDRAHFFQVLFPYLAHLVLQLPTLFPIGKTCLPQLVTGVDASVTLSAAQCATLFACQFFSLIAPRPYRSSNWPACNMDAFFSVTRAPMSGKHLLMFNYLARIEDPRESIPERFITFHRRCLDEDALAPFDDLSANMTPLQPVEYHSSGCIEDAKHALQADFANKYIGGGVLFSGCVQEEIRFCLSPECIVSMILCEVMAENESIQIIGPGMYSHYKGYGGSLEFGSNLPDEGLELDEFHRKSNCIVAIDAIDFCHNEGSNKISPQTQWEVNEMLREATKAYVGFSFEQKHLGKKFEYDSVATGNWGCGAFGGYVPLKFLLQWLSISLAGRKMRYYGFANPLAEPIPEFVSQLEREFSIHPITVGELWQVLVQVSPILTMTKVENIDEKKFFKGIIEQLRALRAQ